MAKVVTTHPKRPVIRKDQGNGLRGLWSSFASRFDHMGGWLNVLTGIGTEAFDKVRTGEFVRRVRLTDQLLEDLYNGDDIAARIVDVVPEEALSEGYEITIEPDEEGEETALDAKRIGTDVGAFLETQLRVTERLVEAWVWGRLFGLGAVYVVTNGGEGDQAEPLDEDAIRSVDSLIVLDRQELIPHRYYTDPAASNFGLVESYRLQKIGPVGDGGAAQIHLVEIHETRLIVFGGARTTIRERQIGDGSDLSVLQRVHDVLRAFNLSWAALANMLQAASQGVFKMHGLIEMIGSGEASIMQQRMGLVDIQRSVARSIVIDAELEEYVQVATNFASVPDSLRVFMLRIAAAAKMPVTVLMGMSPAGMNATGESDRLIFAKGISSEQERTLRPRLMRLAELVMRSSDGPTDGVLPERWAIVFPELVQLTEKEQTEIRKIVADIDAIYIDRGVLLPEEVAVNRFPMGGFSANTSIEMEDRNDILENGPAIEPEPPAPPPTVIMMPPGTQPEPEPEPDTGSEHLEDLERGDQRAPAVIQTLILSKERFETLAEARAWVSEAERDFRSDKVDETETSFRFRQRNPGAFREGSLRTIELTEGVSAVIGRLKEGS